MRLLLEQNAGDRKFVALLRDAGHDVETSVAALGVGARDEPILAYAIATARVIVTRDCADFQALAAASPGHAGMLLIFAGGIASAPALVRAVDRIDALFARLDDLVLSLVEFSW